jgi:hypothetical protein
MCGNKDRLPSLNALYCSVLKLIERELVLFRFNFGSFPILRALVSFGRNELVSTVVILVCFAFKVSAIIANSAGVGLNLQKHCLAFSSEFEVLLSTSVVLNVCNDFYIIVASLVLS